jgi:1-acyl-sn-glycerol-3-phosphate acyltransferase
MRTLRRGWRAARTGTAFAVFGIGALLLVGVVFPLLACGAAGRRRELRAQWVIHQTFRAFVTIMRALGLFRLTWEGRDRLGVPGGRVVVANHPTLIDVVLLIAALPHADCVVKKAAWRNRFLRRIVAAAGYIPNDDGPDVAAACVARVRAGATLLLFPEGTRSPRARLGGFYRGAARIALEAGCDVVPVVIRCQPPTLAKGERWFDVPPRRPHITIEVQPAVSASAGAYGAAAPLAARRLTDDLHHLFEQRLSHAVA